MRRILQLAGSVVFTFLCCSSGLAWSVVVAATLPLPRAVAYHLVVGWVTTMFFLLRKLCGLDYVVEGLENIPEKSSVVLLKHSSTWETLAEIMIFPPQTWVVKRELLWAPLLGWAIWRLKPIAINRKGGSNAVEQVIQQGTRKLEDGLWVMIFPEGTRVPRGESRRYGVSGVLLAQANDLPVLPVAHNAGDYWPRRGWLKRPGTIRVVIGAPIATADRSARDVNREVREWIEGSVAAMGD